MKRHRYAVRPRDRVIAGIVILILSVMLTTNFSAYADDTSVPQVAHWTLTTAADWDTGTLEGVTIRTDKDDGALTLAPGRTHGRFTSVIHRTPFPINATALFWTADTLNGNGLVVEVRLSQDQMGWSPWYLIDNPETQSDGHTYGENIVAFDGATFVQFRVALSTGTPARAPTLDDLTVVLIDTSGAPTLAQALAAAETLRPSTASRPAVISREAWGAKPEHLDWEPEYAPVQRMVLHHTVTGGGSNPVSEVQAIYYYHAVTRGWGDIGYNYLVDQYGNIYEGRYGGDDVIGAHTARWNTGALGVSLLGCYDPNACSPGQIPSAAALDAIADLIAWTSNRRVIDPRKQATFTNVYDDPPLSLGLFAGHRDYSQQIDGTWYNTTSCPGETLYGKLTGLRQEAWSRLPDDDVRFDGHNLPAGLQPGQTVTVGLSLRNAGKASWTPADVRLGYRWFDEQGTLVSETTDAASLPAEIPFARSVYLTSPVTAPPIAGTYALHWDLYRPGSGWLADLSSTSNALAVPVTVTNPTNLPHRLFLPLITRGETSESCNNILANGGAEEDSNWVFLGGLPGSYSMTHSRSGSQSIRLGIENPGDDGYTFSSAQQTIKLPAGAARITLSFWRYPSSSNLYDDRAYVTLLDGGGSSLQMLWLDTSNARAWQPVTFDVTNHGGQTITLRFTVVNQASPGTSAYWLDDLSLTTCWP